VCRHSSAAQIPLIPMLQVGLGEQLLRCAAPHGPSALDDVVAVGDAREVADVLVDHEHGLAAAFQHRQAIPDLVAYEGREAFGGLVQDQEFSDWSSARGRSAASAARRRRV
jgi:hypothetical protein